jgi:hypothetical protein
VKADYDSEANALGIELIDVDRWDDGGEFDDYYCNIAFSQGHLAYIGLLYPSENLHLLSAVAERYELDAEMLLAVARAALAAPDHPVTLGDRLAA